MQFVKTEDLKTGMRLAKPIYNSKGVLLYDRNSKLTSQGIESVKNFNLIGLYVLEPAEPLPPMSLEDMEFEKFQMVSVFSVKEELTNISQFGRDLKIRVLAENIVRKYGRLDHKMNFIQNLRSASDFVFKHSLNVAILTALILNKLGVRPEEKINGVTSALVHDVGKLKLNSDLLVLDELDSVQMSTVRSATSAGLSMIDGAFTSVPNIKRAVMQCIRIMNSYDDKTPLDGAKLIPAAKALAVAEMYDRMTAMSANGEPKSEVAVLKELYNNPQYFDKDAVKALVQSVNFLAEGCCVDLSNGEKALVISSNNNDILRPTVLLFNSNTIVDLAQTMLYGDLEIVDIMKTLDNRYVMGDELKTIMSGGIKK